MIIVDRFEGNYAVIEIDGKIFNVEKSKVSKEVKEGDILKLVDEMYYKDKKATENRTKKIEDKFKDMWED